MSDQNRETRSDITLSRNPKFIQDAEQIGPRIDADHPLENCGYGLNYINTEFTSLGGYNLTGYFARKTDLSVASMSLKPMAEIVSESQASALFFLITMKPLEGYLLLRFPAEVVAALVEISFGGGGGEQVDLAERGFSKIEIRTIREVALVLIRDLREAFEPVYPTHPKIQRVEWNWWYLTEVPMAEEIVQSSYKLKTGDFEGEFDLCLPVNMLVPIKGHLSYQSLRSVLRERRDTLARSSSTTSVEEAIKVLNNLDEASLAGLALSEHPQVIAYLLCQLDSSLKAARVLARLPEEIRTDTTYRITTMGKVRSKMKPLSLCILADNAHRWSIDHFKTIGGPGVSCHILEKMNDDLADDIMASLRDKAPGVVERILEAEQDMDLSSNNIAQTFQREREIDFETARKQVQNRQSFSSLSERQLESRYRQTIVEAMVSSVEYWFQTTGNDQIDLAENSGIWNVYLDRGSYQTRTMDKYLNLDKLPQKPRWKDVVNTVRFVLENGPDTHPDKQKLRSTLSELRTLIQLKANSDRPTRKQ